MLGSERADNDAAFLLVLVLGLGVGILIKIEGRAFAAGDLRSAERRRRGGVFV
jgi:hypothetical protein